MLESRFNFPFDSEEAYRLTLPMCDTWQHSKKRVLVVMQTVDSRDLKLGGMLSDKTTMMCFKNCVKYMRTSVRTHREGADHAAFAVVNMNAKRHLHLKATARKSAEVEFAARIHKIIAKLRPTHVLVSGDDAMRALWPQVQNSEYKRGWVHDLQSGTHKVKVVSTLDYARLLEKDGQWANLLGFWCKHFGNLLLGQQPYSLASVVVDPRYVDTIEKFDKLYKLLVAGKVVAVDTETKDLSVLHNSIYTIQFAFDEKPDVGYMLPLHHPMTPWSKEDLKYIKTRLKRFFQMKDKELVTMNGMYDLRVIRRQFKLPIIWHNVWEITSGEHGLDENISELSQFGAKPGGLAAIYCSHGNDFYFRSTTSFSKADRNTTGSIKPNDPGFVLYGCTDVCSILHIRRSQIAWAGHQEIDGHNFKPYFVRHMIHQMGDTAHQLSHLREDGSLVDAKYLKFLTSKESPIRTEMKILSDSLKAYPEAQEANKKIIADSGLKAKGLFGSKIANWALSFSKPTHLRTLFFDILGLEPISTTKEGTPSVDKEMIEAYKDSNAIVSEYGEYTKLSKLLSTYARGWYKKLLTNSDSVTDFHLRPDYSSFDVTTGRLASKNPSLQTIPSRGKLVKIIKRMFIAKRGTLLVRFDYSAHEVRVWSIASGDLVLAAAFRAGQKLRQLFIVDPTDANKKAIKEKGDIHILNVLRFFGKLVDKEHPLRDAVKSVIFGVLYGKSAETLGIDTKTGDLMALKEKIRNLTAQITELEK